MRTLAGLILWACLACACGPRKPPLHPVVKLAQFDLDCPKKKLTYTRINQKTVGVRGCGKKVKYVKLCRTRYELTLAEHEECTWVKN